MDLGAEIVRKKTAAHKVLNQRKVMGHTLMCFDEYKLIKCHKFPYSNFGQVSW